MKPTAFFLSIILSIGAARAGNDRSEAAATASSAELSLAEITRAVLSQNAAIKQARAKWSAMRARVPQAAAWEDLRISATAKVARLIKVPPESFTDQQLMLEQTIPISGKNRSRARIAAAEAWSVFQELRRQELDAVSKARAAYFRLAGANAQIELIRQNLVSLKQFAEISRAKYEVGTQTQADVLLAETELARLTETQRDVQRTIFAAQSQLNALMNRDAFASLGRPAPLAMRSAAQPPVSRLRVLMLENRPELKMAHAGLEAENARLQLAKREWIPDPSVTATAMRYNAAAQAVSEFDTGVSFNVPWTNYRKYSAAEREARSNVESAQHDLDRLRTESLALLRDQLAKIETLHHHYALFSEQLIPQSRQAIEANQLGYQSNKSGFLELITAQRNLRELQALAVEHLTDYQSALAELEAIVGADLQIFPAAETKPAQHSK